MNPHTPGPFIPKSQIVKSHPVNNLAYRPSQPPIRNLIVPMPYVNSTVYHSQSGHIYTVPTSVVIQPQPGQYHHPQFVSTYTAIPPPPPPSALGTNTKQYETYIAPDVSRHDVPGFKNDRKQSHAIPIINPVTRKDITEEIRRGKSLSPENGTEEVTAPPSENHLASPDTTLNYSGSDDEDLQIESDDPSISASIKQIPLNLESTIDESTNESKETNDEPVQISLKRTHSNYDTHNLQSNFHVQNKNKYRYKSKKSNRHDFVFSNDHMPKKSQNRRDKFHSHNTGHSSNRNFVESKAYTQQSNSFSGSGNNSSSSSDQSFDIDQNEESFEYNQKPLLQNQKISMDSDVNSNYIQTNCREFNKWQKGIALENLSTTKTLNHYKCKYTLKELERLKKSPLVLPDPPTVRDNLLNQKLPDFVWKFLFEKEYRHENSFYDSNIGNKQQNQMTRKLQKNNSFGNNGQHMRTKRSPDKGIIKVNLCLKEEIKLNKAENSWKPSHMNTNENLTDEELEILKLTKNFRSMLNKLTEENFDSLIKELSDFQKYPIDKNRRKLSTIVELLFEKSISEPGYASMYAKLCNYLYQNFKFESDIDENDKSKTSNLWKKCLIVRCQCEFERCDENEEILIKIQEELNNTEDQEEKDKLEETSYKIRQRANGTVQFIGELYKINMISTKIMKGCILKLLESAKEESIERLCKLFPIVGAELESSQGGIVFMNSTMHDLAKLGLSGRIKTTRIKFEIQNVIDLRNSNWKPRENSRLNETNPKKLQEINDEEALKKRMQQELLQDYIPGGSRQNSCMRKQKQQNKSYDKDGFKTISKGHFDFKNFQLPIRRSDEISLGPTQGLFKNFNSFNVPAFDSNPFEKLSTDCDGPEELALTRSARLGSLKNNNNGRKDKTDTKTHTPSPQASEDDDDFALSSKEAKIKVKFMDKLKEFREERDFEALKDDVKKLGVSEKILGVAYSDMFDQKSSDRKEFIDIIIKLLEENVLDRKQNAQALEAVLRFIPEIICDVPFAYTYITDYCIQMISGNVLQFEEVQSICKDEDSKKNVLVKLESYVQDTICTFEFMTESLIESETTPSGHPENLNKLLSEVKLEQTPNQQVERREPSNDVLESQSLIFMEQSLINSECSTEVAKSKSKKSLQEIMGRIIYKISKLKNVQDICKVIDIENCLNEKNFIKELTIELLQNCYEPFSKYNSKKFKRVEFSKCLDILTHCIGNEITREKECIDAIYSCALKNSKLDVLDYLFDLFYNNKVISKECFKLWKEEIIISSPECKSLQITATFFEKNIATRDLSWAFIAGKN